MVKKDTPFFLYSQDSRADASFYGFVNLDPYASAATSQAAAGGMSGMIATRLAMKKRVMRERPRVSAMGWT